MSSTSDFGNDPAAIERESDEIRADMSATLDALGRKLSPGEIMDRSFNLLKDHGGEFATSLGDHIRRNPLPFAVTAAGLAWLIASQRSSSSRYEDYEAGSTVDTAWDQPGYVTSSETDSIAGASGWGTTSAARGSTASSGGIKQRIKGAASHLRERVQETRSAARERMQASRQRLSSTSANVRSGRDATMNRMSSAARSTRSQARRARQDFSTLVDERPMVFGAIGVVIGALIGAALPASRREDELLGAASDRALQRAKEMGSERYEEMRQRAKTAAQRAQEAALQTFQSGDSRSGDISSGGQQSMAGMGSQREEGSFRGESRPIGRA